MQSVYTYCRADGINCKYNTKYGCDSYITIFIDDDDVLKSPKELNKLSYDAKITYTTVKIPKISTTIRIEVRDASSGGLILSTEGNVDSFLSKPLREGDFSCKTMKKINSMEIVSFWQDEYKSDDIA